jgi:hypothetical protein
VLLGMKLQLLLLINVPFSSRFNVVLTASPSHVQRDDGLIILTDTALIKKLNKLNKNI